MTVVVFRRPPRGLFWAPKKQLVALEKVGVAAGTEKIVKSGIDLELEGVYRLSMLKIFNTLC